MNLIIFSDIDGTIMNHDNYSTGNLDGFFEKIKNEVDIIFNTSKTFEEVVILNKKLNINNPFIVENGACIFFPKDYVVKKDLNIKLFQHKNYFGYKLTKLCPKTIENNFFDLKKKYNFSFYNELSEQKFFEVTNLKKNNAKKSKKRLFTNPILWEDSESKFMDFKSEILSMNKNYHVVKGGRFIHISDNYNKGTATKEFLKIIKKSDKLLYKTVSLGDSESDVCMLELTDYSCIIKTKRKKISLKKSKNNYFSTTMAPEGWKESLDFVFKKENRYF